MESARGERSAISGQPLSLTPACGRQARPLSLARERGDLSSTPGAAAAWGEGAIFVSAPRVGHGSADRLAFRPPRPHELSHTVMVHVEDVDRHYEHARQRGARILLPLETYAFGERQYSAQDLGGHLWTFTQSVADVAPEEWGATPAKERS